MMKQFLKEIIKKQLFKIIKIKNIIIMESNPDFTDNTKKVFDRLIENKVNNKYRIIWFVNNSKQFKNIKMKNVKFLSVFSQNTIMEKIKKTYYMYSAKIIIDCNKYIPKVRKNQFRLHLCHGTPLKKVDGYCKAIGDTDYILEIGKFFRKIDSKYFDKNEKCFLDLGFPRNDELLDENTIKDIFPEYIGKKIIVWLPTYRKHKGNNEKYKESQLKYGLPAINTENDLKRIDNILKQKNIIILIKLHPAQDARVIKAFECNNIKLITDEKLIKKEINLYKLLAASDALITDYSSVYYDYLLTKKPIGLAISDIEEYKENVGFVQDYYELAKGEYIYNSNDIIKFIENVAVGDDKYFDERMKCLKLYHTHCDNKSSERVYEFIKKYL